jgi:hypothetical protein
MSKSLFQQHEAIDNQCYHVAKAMFLKLQDAHVIHDDNTRREGFNPAKDYEYTGFEMTKTGIRLSGSQYVGGGEYYYVSIDIPLDRIDNLDEFIREKQEERAEAQRQRRAARMAEEAAETERQAQWERDKYEELKAKFEGDQK